MSLLRAQLAEDAGVKRSAKPGRHAWIQIIEGVVEVNGQLVGEGDGAAIEEPDELTVTGVSQWSDVLLFDLA